MPSHKRSNGKPFLGTQPLCQVRSRGNCSLAPKVHAQPQKGCERQGKPFLGAQAPCPATEGCGEQGKPFLGCWGAAAPWLWAAPSPQHRSGLGARGIRGAGAHPGAGGSAATDSPCPCSSGGVLCPQNAGGCARCGPAEAAAALEPARGAPQPVPCAPCPLRARSLPTPLSHWGSAAPALLKTHKESCETGILVCIVIQHRSISSTITCANLPSICTAGDSPAGLLSPSGLSGGNGLIFPAPPDDKRIQGHPALCAALPRCAGLLSKRGSSRWRRKGAEFVLWVTRALCPRRGRVTAARAGGVKGRQGVPVGGDPRLQGGHHEVSFFVWGIISCFVTRLINHSWRAESQ
ncbi:uncharacterized protein LOC106629928 isoform X1 [Zonotrichia albicollis]|uniref:uncharacterized protein LOC106629928 isoform X1 n=1 Tax=Zonotrichia albicollis TaxID=44394 RepID=UPI003D81122A